MKNHKLLSVFSFTFFLLSHFFAVAQPAGPGCPDVLDQQVTSFNSGSAGVDQWQSFTVGITGKLTKVEFMTNGCTAYSYTLSVYSGQGTGGTMLYSSAFSNPGICNNWCTAVIPVGSAPSVTATSIYTFRIQGSASINDVVNTGNIYGGGLYYSTDYGQQNNWDLNFRTYVQQTTYPPASISAGGSTTFCPGSNVLLTANSGSFVYQWWNGATSIGGATSINHSATASGNYVAVVTNTSTNCWNVSNQIGVTVLPAPTANSSNIAVCQGSGANLNVTGSGGTPGYSYSWYDAPTGGTQLTSTSTLNTNPSDPPGTYLFFPQVTDANGCKSIRPAITVTVNALPAISVSGGPVNCNGGTAILNASGATSYTWAPGGLTGPGQTLSAGSYTVTGQNAAGCTNSTTYTLTQPSPLSGSYSGVNTVCSGAGLSLNLSGAGGVGPYNYQWITSNNAATTGETTTLTSTSTINDVISNSTLIQQNLTYTVTVYDNNSCSATHTLMVNVDPIPSVTSTAGSSVCSGSNAAYNLSANIAGSTFSWVASSNANISGESTSAQNTSTISDVLTNITTTAQTVVYNITPTSPAGCAGTAQVVNITVNPVPSVTSASGVGICSGSGANYTITSDVAGSTYSWVAANNSNVAGESLSAQSGSSINEILTSSSSIAENVSYTITPTSAAGCTGSGFVFFTSVNPVPVMTSSNNAAICSGGAVNINLTSSISSTFNWIAGDNVNTTGESLTNQSTSTLNNTITTASAVPQIVSYSVTPTATVGGCSGSIQTVNVTVNPLPVMTSASSSTICSGNAINIPLTSNVSSTYSWLANNNANTTGESTSAQSTSLINNTITSSNTTGTEILNYTVTPTSVAGCPGNPQAVSITINPAPVMTSSNSASVCSGSPVNIPLTSSVTSNYQWSAADNTNVTGESTSLQSTSTIFNPLVSSTTSANETVLYTVTPNSMAGCAGSAQTVTVTVRPAPVITNALASSVCSGNTLNINLSASVASSFQWSATDNTNTTGESTTFQTTALINNTIVSSNNAASELISYMITPTSSFGCTGISSTYTLTVNPLPVMSSSTSSVICSGTASSLALNSSTPSSYSWVAADNSNTTGESLSAQSSAILNNTIVSSNNSASENVIYSITPTSGAGCTGSVQTVTITVNPAPVVTSSNNTSACSGASVGFSLTSSAAATFQWSATNNPNTSGESTVLQTASSINDIISSSSSTVTENVIYSVVATSVAGCAGPAQSLTVSVNPSPVITNALSSSSCSGATVNIPLSGSVASSFSWIATDNFNTSGESTSIQTSSIINNTLTSTNNNAPEIISYTITPTSLAGCGGVSSTYTLSINPAPVMTSANSSTVCSGTTLNHTLSASVASGFSWIASDNSNTTGESLTSQTSGALNNTIVSSSSSPETVNYTITPTSLAGCAGVSQNVSVSVNPAPVITSPASSTVCSGSPLSINLTSSTPSLFSWIAADNINTTGESTSSQASSSITDIVVSSSSVNESVLYTVSPISLSGCSGTAQTLTVTVSPAPVVTSSATGTICSGNTLNINLTANITSSFSWVAADNLNTTGESTAAQNTSLINDVITSASSVAEVISYSVSPTSGAGCPGALQIVSITVNPNPSIPTAAGTSICSGNTASLTATAPGGTYDWFTVNSGGTSLFTGATYVTPSLATNTTYYVESSLSGCTGARTAVTVTVNPNPSFTITAPASVCTGLDLNFGISGLTGGSSFTYSWSGPGSFSSSLPAPTINGVVNSFGGTYSLNIANEFGCTGNDAANVSVLPSPTASITGGPAVICANETAIFAGSTSTANGDVIVAYQWLLGTSAISGASGVNYTANSPGNYFLVVQNSNGCSDTSLVSPLVVNAVPVVQISGSASFCSGMPFTLDGNGSSAGGSSSFSSFQWLNNSAPIGGTTISESFVSAGSYELIITNSNGCTDTSAAFPVTENFPPAIPLTGFSTLSYCANDSSSASVSNFNGSNTYAWSVNPSFISISAPTAATTFIRGEVSGTYTVSVTATDMNGCSSSSGNTLLTVNSAPVVALTLPSNDTICYNGSVALGISNSGMSIYEWTSSYGQTINSATPTFTNITQTGTVSFFAAVTDANGCKSLYDTVDVVVMALPVVSAGSNLIVCEGTPVTLSASGTAATYSWSGGVINGTPFFPLSTQSYTVTATSGASCSDTSSVMITVKPAPTVNGGNDVSVCAGNSITLSAGGTAASYTWNNGISDGIAFVPVATLSYIVTGTGSNGCSKNDTVLVTVNPLPPVGVSASATSVCSGSSVTLSGTGAVSYIWSPVITNNTAFVPSTTQTYTVTGTDANSCSNTATQIITVNSLPVITAGNSTGNICPGSTASLSAVGANNYSWSDGQSGSLISVSPASTTTYTVTGTDINGCQGSANVSVTVLAQPSTPVPSVNNSSTCVGNNVLFSSSSPNDNNWFNASSLTGIGNQQSFNHTENIAGSYSYGLFVFPSGGCRSDTAYVSVSFNPCVNTLNPETINLTTNGSVTGNIFTNDGNPAGFIANTNPVLNAQNGTFTITAGGSFTYTPNQGYSGSDMVIVQACNTPLCINDTVFIVIYPLANNDAGTVSGLIAGSQLTGNVLINDAGSGIANNVTLVSSVINGTLTLSGNGDFVYTPVTGYCGPDAFTYQVCDANGLCSSANVSITVSCDVVLQVYNSFSPNSDGKNDTWTIANINLIENKVTIYDRWGNEIWKGDNYDNTTVVWNGNNKNNEALPSGTYFYLIEAKGQEAQRGWVEITK